MLIYTSNTTDIVYFKEENMFHWIWKKDSEDLSELDFKDKLKIYIENLQKYQPEKVLIDTKNASYAIVPKLQEWTNSNIIKKSILTNLKKVAIVLSNYFITKLGIKQTFGEDKSDKITRKFFNNTEEAEQWLMS